MEAGHNNLYTYKSFYNLCKQSQNNRSGVVIYDSDSGVFSVYKGFFSLRAIKIISAIGKYIPFFNTSSLDKTIESAKSANNELRSIKKATQSYVYLKDLKCESKKGLLEENKGIEAQKNFLKSLDEEKDNTFALMVKFNNLPEETKNNKDFLLKIFIKNSDFIDYISDFATEKEDFIKLLEHDKQELIHDINLDFAESKDLILAVIKRNPQAFQSIHEELREDHRFVYKAWNENSNVFADSQISEGLIKNINFNFYRGNKDFTLAIKTMALEVIKRNPTFINNIDDSFKQDIKFIEKVIEECPDVLGHIDNSFVAFIIENASNKEEPFGSVLSNNFKFMEIAVSFDSSYFSYVGEELKKDYNFVFYCYKINQEVFKQFDIHPATIAQVIDNTDIIDSNDELYKELPDKYKENKEITLAAIRKQAILSLDDVSDNLKNSQDIILALQENDSKQTEPKQSKFKEIKKRLKEIKKRLKEVGGKLTGKK